MTTVAVLPVKRFDDAKQRRVPLRIVSPRRC